MSAQKFSQYQAYSVATRTVPKTRQIVMLYDGALRFLKQARAAIAGQRIEERFRCLSRASEIMAGLQNSIDYDHGGDVAMTLHRFYAGLCVRILSINFSPENAGELCDAVMGEIKEMREVWHTIDRTLNTSGDAASHAEPTGSSESSNVTLSA